MSATLQAWLRVDLAGRRMQEIESFVDEARQRARVAKSKAVDEFDGLSPEEINAIAASRAQSM